MGKIYLVIATLALIACGNIALSLAKKPRDVKPDAMGQALDVWVTYTEKLLVPAAEALPEKKYSFVPTNGEFAGVRTFAKQVKHLAAANHQLGALAMGEKPPHGEHSEMAPENVKTKAEIVEYLKGSFSYLHEVASRISERSATEQVELPNGRGKDTRVEMLMLLMR